METSRFISIFADEIRNEQAAIFVGAGVSIDSKLPSWKDFAADFAAELGLDIEKETDLLSLFQYYVNNKRCRNDLNQQIFSKLGKDAPTNNTHKELAALPIRTYWTTNCDELLEKAFRENQKTVFVKRRRTDLTLQKPDSDITLYKMHGDAQDPQNAIFTKDDYEYYALNNAPFLDQLKSDLCSKTFLFIGFSLDDPNMKHALAQLHVSMGENMRTHYLIYKRRTEESRPHTQEKIVFNLRAEDRILRQEEEYELKIHHQSRISILQGGRTIKTANIQSDCESTEKPIKVNEQTRRHEDLWMEDLARYGIQTICIDNFDEIPKILKQIRTQISMKEIFISGSFKNLDSSKPSVSDDSSHTNLDLNITGSKGTISAPKNENWTTDLALMFSYKLAYKLASEGNRIITGFGAGVGNSVIQAILTCASDNKTQKIEKYMLGLPFNMNANQESVWSNYRRNSIKQAGIAIFIFGESPDVTAETSSVEDKATHSDENEESHPKEYSTKEEIIKKAKAIEDKYSKGMMEEFRIACEQENCFIIPVAITGPTPRIIWELIEKSLHLFLPEGISHSSDSYKQAIIDKLKELNQSPDTLAIDKIIEKITNLIKLLQSN